MNTGHGHVIPRHDGVRARCGGPGICPQCSQELAQQKTKSQKLVENDPEKAAEKISKFERVLRILSLDMHHPSDRPCETCRDATEVLGEPYGCYRYQAEKRLRAQKES